MSYTVVGLFNNRNQAEAAIRELMQRGFVSEDIDISNRAHGNSSGDVPTQEVVITDSVANFFHSLFSNDKKNANNYTNAAAGADSIVTVHADDAERAREAVFVLDKNGALDIDSAADMVPPHSSQQFTGENRGGLGAPPVSAAQNEALSQNAASIPIIEEQLEVGKRVVETGGVRVKSRIVERPIEENVRLRNQYVIVKRRAVDREVTDEDLSNFREGEIELLELAEVPVIAKHARVVEEVEIGSQVSEHDEIVRDTLRGTDVEVEEITRNAPDTNLNER